MYLVQKIRISIMGIKEFFKQFRVFDGGMGQELLARGIKPISNLWSATALLKEEYHQTVVDTHIDFINAGAEVILTNTFGARLRRCEDTDIVDKFEYLNKTAVDLAKHFGVTGPTVNSIIRRLVREGFVESRPYRSIFLTEKGKLLADYCKKRHEIVYNFLINIGVHHDVAKNDAEGLEHHVSSETLSVFEKFNKT